MNERSMSEALNAIHQEATKLLNNDHPLEVVQRIELIISIARHKHDVRTGAEQQKAACDIVESEEDRRYREMLESDDPRIWRPLS